MILHLSTQCSEHQEASLKFTRCISSKLHQLLPSSQTWKSKLTARAMS